MNGWLVAAAILLVALGALGVAALRGDAIARLVVLEAGGILVTFELVVLAEGYQRPVFLGLALTLALLTLSGGLVFARFLERWL
jgi:multisubunit Na+/H+ antiporter MnhF subunit